MVREVGSWVWLVKESKYGSAHIAPIRITKVLKSCVVCDTIKYTLGEGGLRGYVYGKRDPEIYITLENLQAQYERQVEKRDRSRLQLQIQSELNKTVSSDKLEQILNMLRSE